MNQPDLLLTVERYGGAAVRAAEMYASAHFLGWPDITGAIESTFIGSAIPIREEILTDAEVRESLRLLKSQLKELMAVNHRMVEWLAKYFDLPDFNRTRQHDRQQLQTRFDRAVTTHQRSGLPGSYGWLTEEAYQAMLDVTDRLVVEIRSTHDRLKRRVGQLIDDISHNCRPTEHRLVIHRQEIV